MLLLDDKVVQQLLSLGIVTDGDVHLQQCREISHGACGLASLGEGRGERFDGGFDVLVADLFDTGNVCGDGVLVENLAEFGEADLQRGPFEIGLGENLLHEVDDAGDELAGVEVVGEVFNLDQGLEAEHSLALAAVDFVSHLVRVDVLTADRQQFVKDAGAFDVGVLGDKLKSCRIEIGGGPVLLGLVRDVVGFTGVLGFGLLGGTAGFVLELLTLRRGEVGVGIVRVLGAGFLRGIVDEFAVLLDGLLGGAAVVLLGVELVLHAEEGGVGAESGLTEAVVVEVELVLGDVGEMLELVLDLLEEAAGISRSGIRTWAGTKMKDGCKKIQGEKIWGLVWWW